MSTAPLDVFEAERLIQGLRNFSVHEMGSSSWMKQHHALEKLNLAAHASALTNSDNFVLSGLLTFEKLPVVLHALLSAEIWRENLLPTLSRHISIGGSSLAMRSYFILHQESVAINLLECVLYHDYAATALGDGLIDLVDYCARRIAYLIGRTHRRRNANANAGKVKENDMDDQEFFHAVDVEGDDDDGDGNSSSSSNSSNGVGGVGGGADMTQQAAALLARDEDDPEGATRRQLRLWAAQIKFRVGIACVTVVRYLADYVTRLPISVMTRMLDTHDIAILMVPLLENPPWVRRITRNVPLVAPTTTAPSTAAVSAEQKTKTVTVWQKYTENKWKDVEPRDLLKLTQPEAQPWLTLHALLLEPDCRRRYSFIGHRKSQIGRVRKFLNEVLVDQLPLLTDLQRYIDETTISNSNGAESGAATNSDGVIIGAGPLLLLEALPAVHDGIVSDALSRRVDGPGGDVIVGGGGGARGGGNTSSVSVAAAKKVVEPAAASPKASSIISVVEPLVATPTATMASPPATKSTSTKIMIIDEDEEEEENNKVAQEEEKVFLGKDDQTDDIPISVSASPPAGPPQSSSSSSSKPATEKLGDNIGIGAGSIASMLQFNSSSSGSNRKQQPSSSSSGSDVSATTTSASSSSTPSTSTVQWTWRDLGKYVSTRSMRVRRRRKTLSSPLPSSSDVWPGSDDDGDLMLLGGLYTGEEFDEVALGVPKCAQCGKTAEKRCSRCHNEWYCGRACQVAAWKGHKDVCDIVANARAGEKQ